MNEKLVKFLKYAIVILFYVVGLGLCLGGTTAIAGVPLAVIGYGLQKSFNIRLG